MINYNSWKVDLKVDMLNDPTELGRQRRLSILRVRRPAH